jgi:hypothetical protein
MAKVELVGWGTDLKMMEITPEMVEELTETGVDYDRMSEIEEQMLDDCEMWSGVTPDPGMFSIEVDGEELSREVIDAIMVKQAKAVKPPLGKAYLVRVENNRGCWLSVQSKGDFDPKLMMFRAEQVRLATGDAYQFLSLTYDGMDDFGNTVGDEVDVYVITVDGERRDILEAEEDEGEEVEEG